MYIIPRVDQGTWLAQLECWSLTETGWQVGGGVKDMANTPVGSVSLHLRVLLAPRELLKMNL